jgi:hypothetical protein
MSDLTLERLWCINQQPIPLVAATMDLEDVHKLLESGDQDDMKVLVMNLRATTGTWVDKCLGVKATWWRHHQWRVPLVLEIKKALEESKPKKRWCSLLRSTNLVALKVRGHILLVQNDSRSLALAFEEDKEEEGIKWFLTQLQKDIKALGEPSTSSKAGRQGKRGKDEDTDATEESQFVKNSLKDLRSHKDCYSASYAPSRHSFKVIRTDKVCEEFLVTAFSKKRKKALENMDDSQAMDDFEEAFCKVVSKALKFLQKEEALETLCDQDPDQKEEALETLCDQDPEDKAL